MAKEKAKKEVNRSEFIRTALTKNPDLDLKQINLLWAKAGHTGLISRVLFYQVRRKMGIKSEYRWVQDGGPETTESLEPEPEREDHHNDDLVEAAENSLPHILMFYKRFEEKRPVMLLDLQSQKLYAYPYEEFKAELGEKSQVMLAAAYEKASPKNKIVVFVRDNENRRLASMLFDYE